MQVEIFKTNVENNVDAETVINYLLLHCPGYGINFDLDDCDRILRVEARACKINKKQIIELLSAWGYTCTHLN